MDSKMKLDVLCFAAHPDDVELAMSGSIARMVDQGLKVGIVDITRGELGSRGTPETRAQEAAAASEILGISERINLGWRDGFFEDTEALRMSIITVIRKYQPNIVFKNAPSDRHPDHGRASEIVRTSAFLSGLRKIETVLDGSAQDPWRPARVFSYIQDFYHTPDFVIDITEYFDKRRDAVLAYESQFLAKDGVQTPISTPEFQEFLGGRAMEYGRRIGVKYGEGFLSETPLKIDDINSLL